jgi:hypothetical protein
MSKTLTAAGLLLTLIGAGVLSWRDLGGPGFAKPDYRALLGGFRRREAWLGFPLIALGTILQLVGLFA